MELVASLNPPQYPDSGRNATSPAEPPQYPENSEDSSHPENTRLCEYCHRVQDEQTYTEHLNTAHSKLFFHCDECDTNVDKKDFLFHMSLHAFEYAKKDKNQNPDKEERDKKTKLDVTSEHQNIKDKTSLQDKQIITERNTQEDVKYAEEMQRNEFSDHSDTENDFKVVPNSVFEAIEDTQNIQSIESCQYSESLDECQDSVMMDEVQTNRCSDSQNSQCLNIENARSLVSDEYLPNESISDISSDECNEPKPAKGKKKIPVRTCPICSKMYTAYSSYFYHIKHHHGAVKKHECDVCERKFSTKSSLAEHVTIHTGEQQRKCKECGKAFRSKASLYIHEQLHTGIKTWECSQCYKTFRWRTHLLRHLKRHSNEKVHVCATCKKGFSVRSDLNRHARTHEGGNYPCTECGNKKFAQLRYLKVHMLRIHGQAYEADKSKQTNEPATGNEVSEHTVERAPLIESALAQTTSNDCDNEILEPLHKQNHSRLK